MPARIILAGGCVLIVAVTMIEYVTLSNSISVERIKLNDLFSIMSRGSDNKETLYFH